MTSDNLERFNLSAQLLTYVDTAVSYSMVSHKRLGVTYQTYHCDKNFKLHYLKEQVFIGKNQLAVVTAALRYSTK